MVDQADRQLRAAEDRLRLICQDLDDQHIRAAVPNEEWTIGDILSHLAEMPDARGRDLAILLAGTGQPFGRDESDHVRLDAIQLGRTRPAAELVTLALSALEVLRCRIADLSPDQLRLTGRYQDGTEMTVATFVDRHIGHLEGHIDQIVDLQRLIANAG